MVLPKVYTLVKCSPSADSTKKPTSWWLSWQASHSTSEQTSHVYSLPRKSGCSVLSHPSRSFSNVQGSLEPALYPSVPSACMLLSILLIRRTSLLLLDSVQTSLPMASSLSLLHGHRSSAFKAPHTSTNQNTNHILLMSCSLTFSCPLRTKSIPYHPADVCMISIERLESQPIQSYHCQRGTEACQGAEGLVQNSLSLPGWRLS